jgi:hypothetical protein
MALIEKFFDVHHSGLNFFDHMFADAAAEMDAALAQMQRMRAQMFQLLPHDPLGDTLASEMAPRVPIVEERGETKLKLEFNVQDFRPEEVQVKILGSNILQVSVAIITRIPGSCIGVTCSASEKSIDYSAIADCFN